MLKKVLVCFSAGLIVLATAQVPCSETEPCPVSLCHKSSHCIQNECAFIFAEQGKTCGDGKQCIEGACQFTGVKRRAADPVIETEDGKLLLNAPAGVQVDAGDVHFNLDSGTFAASDLAAKDSVNSLEGRINTGLDSANSKIDDAQAAFETAISKALEAAAAAAASDLQDTVNPIKSQVTTLGTQVANGKADSDGNKQTLNQVKQDVNQVTSNLDQVKRDLAKTVTDLANADKCPASGTVWNGAKCIAQNTLVGVSADLKCNGDNAGRMRFDTESKGLQVCNGEEWTGVGSGGSSAKPCSKEYGSDPCNPAISCRALGVMGRVPKGTGKDFWIGTMEYSSKWRCRMDRMWGVGDTQGTWGGLSYGDGSDGDFTCNKRGTVYINEIFPHYSPKDHRIPQWRNVAINGGCTLSVVEHDSAGDVGGMLAFRVSGKLTIHSSGSISVDGTGWTGGIAPGWRAAEGVGSHEFQPHGYSSNTRSQNGMGMGGGAGGNGGLNYAHGSGGGGGAFGRKGGKGTPDRCRNNRGNHDFGHDHDNSYSPSGREYMYKSNLYHPYEVMGSGGGAGGAGHPHNSIAPAQNGGTGGGTMQIFAKNYQNNGKLFARGNQGYPRKTFREWPNGNAQSGSGGAGSGGLIKLVTGDGSATGSYTTSGGGQPLVTNWCQRDHQRGGNGGTGRISHIRRM